MNAVTKEEQTALTLPQRAAVALGESANEAKLRELVAKSAGIVAITNADGRDEAHRAGMVLLKTRTGIRATGKAARDDATKFSKAVIAMEDELIGIIEPEETRVLTLRDQWDEKIAAEKAAKIAAERARTEAIAKAIQQIRDIPLMAVGKSSADIGAMIGGLVSREPDESFEEFIEQAKVARYEALDKLTAAETAQRAIEIEAESQRQEAVRQAAAAETARLAEVARIVAVSQELARLRAESERIANEQAIEAKRLADLAAAQEAAAAALRAKAEANLRAEREAQETAMRLERERNAAEQAKAAANLKAAQDALAAQVAAHEAAVKLEADHAEALEMNATIDADRHARAQAMVDQAIADAAAMPATLNELMAATLSLPESVSEHDAMVDAGFDEGPSDNEIIDAVMMTFGWSYDEATKRLTTIDYAAAWAERVEMEA
jgi:hypothetical protein